MASFADGKNHLCQSDIGSPISMDIFLIICVARKGLILSWGSFEGLTHPRYDGVARKGLILLLALFEGLTHPRYDCAARKGLGCLMLLFLGFRFATPQAMESHPCQGSNKSRHTEGFRFVFAPMLCLYRLGRAQLVDKTPFFVVFTSVMPAQETV